MAFSSLGISFMPIHCTKLTPGALFGVSTSLLNPIQTGGGGGFSNIPSGKIVITFTPKEL